MILFALACAAPDLAIDVREAEGGLELVANQPVETVLIEDAVGQPVTARRDAGTAVVYVPAPLQPGESLTVRAEAGGGGAETRWTVPPAEDAQVVVEVPGQWSRSVDDGDVVRVPVVGEPTVRVRFSLLEDTTTGEVRVDGHPVRRRSYVRAERDWFDVDLQEPAEVEVQGVAFTLLPDRVQGEVEVDVVGTAFPTDPEGRRDVARPAGRVVLPAGWWRDWMRSQRIGFRAPDHQAPWGWQAVTLRNHGEDAANVVIEGRVLEEGAPAHAFRPRLRDLDGETDHTSALLRVPEGSEVTATVPVYLDGKRVTEGTYTREIRVLPFGGEEPIAVVQQPLVVRRGSGWSAAGFLGVFAVACLGWGMVVFGGRRWLAAARTSELTTVALFGAVSFVAGAGAQLVGLGVATVLGPFAPLVTGLLDDAVRACLMGTLVTLLPRPGIVSLSVLLGYLMRAMALGSAHPVDALYLGTTMATLEGCLWLSGITRWPAWRDGSRWSRWLRLSLAFGTAQLVGTASALLVSVVLYRLYFAAWYVALILALPGFLYMWVGCWFAVDFARTLREVAE